MPVDMGFSTSMQEDLELTERKRYSIITLALFPTYVVFELPPSVVIRWIGLRL
jgi:hypothetical protein